MVWGRDAKCILIYMKFQILQLSLNYLLKRLFFSWLVWLSRLSTSLWTKGSPVRFPVRAHAWVAGQVPSVRHMRGSYTLMFLSLYFSSPSPLSKNKKIKSLKKRLFFPSLNWLGTFVKIWLTTNIRVYFLTLNFIPFIYIITLVSVLPSLKSIVL